MAQQTTHKLPRILVDADSCSVMEETAEVAIRFGIEVHFFTDYSHLLSFDSPLANVHLVDGNAQAVDMAIVNASQKDDIVVTADLGLASLVLNKGAIALSPSGTIYKPEKMAGILEKRHLHKKLRKAKVRIRGGKTSAFTAQDRRSFVKTLSDILHRTLP